MSKLYQVLERTFKMRINSNDEIIPYIKKLAELGKFDEPKKIAAIAILLDRLGKLEDELEMEKTLSDIATSTTKEPSTPLETNPSPSSEVTDTTEMPVNSISDIKVDESAKETEAKNPETSNEQPQTVAQEAPTVSEFTPEAITDPVTPPTTPDSTTV